MHQGLRCMHHRHLCLYVCLCLFLCHFLFFIFVFFFFSLVERRTKCIKVFVTIIKGTFSKAHIITFQKRKALFSNCRPTSLAVENPKLPSGKQEDLVSKNLPKAKKAQNSFWKEKKQGTHIRLRDISRYDDPCAARQTSTRRGKQRGRGGGGDLSHTDGGAQESHQSMVPRQSTGESNYNRYNYCHNSGFALVLSASPRFQIPVGWIQWTQQLQRKWKRWDIEY